MFCLPYFNTKNSHKIRPPKETNLSTYCITCNGLTTIFDEICLNCYISTSKNKLNNIEGNKKQFVQMSYCQRRSEHLDYQNTTWAPLCSAQPVTT
jgi:hypothetical protein